MNCNLKLSRVSIITNTTILQTYLLRNSSTFLPCETIFWTKGNIIDLWCRFSRVWDERKKSYAESFFCYFLILQEIFNIWFANESSQSKDDHEYSEKDRKILLHALVQTFGSYFCSDGLRGRQIYFIQRTMILLFYRIELHRIVFLYDE